MTILAFFTTIGTDPSPTILLILDSVQEKLAGNNCVLWHVLCALTRVFVEINGLLVFRLYSTFLTFKTLSTLEK